MNPDSTQRGRFESAVCAAVHFFSEVLLLFAVVTIFRSLPAASPP